MLLSVLNAAATGSRALTAADTGKGCPGLAELSCVPAAAPSTPGGHQAELKMGVRGNAKRSPRSHSDTQAPSLARPAVSLADPTLTHTASQRESRQTTLL